MKRNILIIFMSIFLSISFVSAISLDVSVKPISDSYIIDLNQPAEFNLVIKNNGLADTFEIYSLVGVDINPDTKYNLAAGETRTIKISAVPQDALKSRKGFFTFEYLIKSSKSGETQKQRLSMNIVSLEEAISIVGENLNPNSENVKLTLKNTIMNDFDEIKLTMKSAFFDYYDTTLSLKALESKELSIGIDKERLKKLTAGQYIIETQITTESKTADKQVIVKFLEQENIETLESDEGILIKRLEISKNNIGNVKKKVSVMVQKNLIAYLFTTTNIVPTSSEIKGFSKYYTWEQELSPGDELKVIVKTNWLYPILIIILIIVLIILIKRYVEKDISFKKTVSYVNTRGGEFALKVHLRVKAKRYVERVKIVDKIPGLVSLYDKFGAVTPDKIDMINKRLEWNVEALNKGEERIFSYIIYSKIGIIGRFELPSARAIYEKDGEVKDTSSNRSFFVNEPKRSRM
ncbi:MAG: hypothetical protein WC979_07300 [Candidatus Pacearchaeota archaeon]|jgi:hypothetical protein